MDYNKEVDEHYRRIRTDPYYRMMEQLEDMRAEQIPGFWPIGIPEEPTVEEVKIIHKHIHLDRKALEHQERIVALETKSHTHTDKKTNKDTKYIYNTIKMEDDSKETPLTN